MKQSVKTATGQSVLVALRNRVAAITGIALIVCAVLAALGTIYLVGLEPLPLFHDSFHDVRHSNGFPCH